MERIGLIAGAGNFPFTFAKEAKKKGDKIIAFAIKGVTSPEFGKFVDRIHWLDLSKFKVQNFLLMLITERIKKNNSDGNLRLDLEEILSSYFEPIEIPDCCM